MICFNFLTGMTSVGVCSNTNGCLLLSYFCMSHDVDIFTFQSFKKNMSISLMKPCRRRYLMIEVRNITNIR